MNPAVAGGLLIDTNLLVLLAVGTVNLHRVEKFKRTRQYSKADYALLRRVIGGYKPLYTVPHVLTEVSNLTDLSGAERQGARAVLKEMISVLSEESISSGGASDHKLYEKLGLADAAIGKAARTHGCSVLTDDLDLYLRLSNEKVKVYNFTHLRAQQWRL
jgi:hypothetical protein